MDGGSIAKMLMDRSSRVAAKTELEALDKVAKQRAANALVARFQDASDLNELEMVLADTTEKLRSVSAAVDSTYAKHDERVQHILVKVDEAHGGVGNIRSGMVDLRGAVGASRFWASTEELAAAKHVVRDAQAARVNIDRSLDLCHQWLGVPARVAQLRESLEAEPLMLYHVWRELRDLAEWRAQLALLLSKHNASTSTRSGHGAGAAAGGGPGSPGGGGGSGGNGPGNFVGHLNSVAELAAAVRDVLWSNVSRCYELGVTNPQALVMTFRVVEEHAADCEARAAASKANKEKLKAAAASRRVAAAQPSSLPLSPVSARSRASTASDTIGEGSLSGASNDGTTYEGVRREQEEGGAGVEEEEEEKEEDGLPGDDEDYRQTAQTLLATAITDRAMKALAQFDGVAEGHVEGALAAASQVLSELTTIVTEVAPCAPPEYQVVPLAKNLYHSFLLGPLEALYSQPTALDMDPLLKLVEWLDYYNAEMDAILTPFVENPEARICVEFTHAADSLLSEYMARMRSQLAEWIDRVNVLGADQVKDPATGHLVTSFPNDMMRVLREQLDLAFLRLRPHRFILVLNPAAVALRSNQLQFDDVVASALNAISKREAAAAAGDANSNDSSSAAEALPNCLSVEDLCAVGNDLVRMSTLVSDYRNELAGKVNAKGRSKSSSSIGGSGSSGSIGISVREALSVFDDASREYLELAFQTTGHLARTVLLDLLPTVRRGVGSPAWESPAEGAMVVGTLTTTLGDYFGDLSAWSDEYLWPRCVRACLEGLLCAYLEQLAAREGAPPGLDFDQGIGSSTNTSGSSSSSGIGGGLRSTVSSGGGGLKRAASAAKMASTKWRNKATAAAAATATTMTEANATTTSDGSAAVAMGLRSGDGSSSDTNSGASEGGNEQQATNSHASSSSSYLRTVNESSALLIPPPFKDISGAATRLDADAAALMSFFGAFDDELEAAGLRVNEALALAAPPLSPASSSPSPSIAAASAPSGPAAQAWAPLRSLAAILRASDPSAASADVINCVASLRAANLQACPAEPPARFQRCATNLLTMVWARRPPADASGGDVTAAEMAEFEEIVAAVFD